MQSWIASGPRVLPQPYRGGVRAAVPAEGLAGRISGTQHRGAAALGAPRAHRGAGARRHQRHLFARRGAGSARICRQCLAGTARSRACSNRSCRLSFGTDMKPPDPNKAGSGAASRKRSRKNKTTKARARMSSSGNIIPMKSSSASTNTRHYTEALERALGIIVARSQADLNLVRERAEAIAAMASAKVAEADARFALIEQSRCRSTGIRQRRR